MVDHWLMHHLRRSLIWLTIFSVAMGFLESAVVIYLRQLYYPNGFEFPLAIIPHNIAVVELLREAATIIMLLSIGIIAGKNIAQRFAFFIFSFAVWDIGYYVFLKWVLGWPSSLFTWDILFLIPVPWVGPVIAPCIVSATMIFLTLIIIVAAEKDEHVRISKTQWLMLSSGGFVIFLSFMYDYLHYIFQSGHSIWTPATEQEMFLEISNYIPQSFNWWMFGIGEVLTLIGVISIQRAINSLRQKTQSAVS